MSEFIKALQIWAENPISNNECNTPQAIPCTGILCKECPMDTSGSAPIKIRRALDEFNERVNKNIVPMD
jgi:hypothetical protein